MNVGDPRTMYSVFMYTLLVIFVFTAILSLASLPGWVKLPENYRAKLFTALILEVVGCVIGFVYAGTNLVKQANVISPITPALLANEEGWHWQYANRNWRTEASFIPNGDAFDFSATTFYRLSAKDKDVKTPIFTWKSASPFRIPKDGQQLEFDCVQVVLPSVSEVYADAPIPGERKMKITLSPFIGLRGKWRVQTTQPTDVQSTGGMFFTNDRE